MSQLSNKEQQIEAHTASQVSHKEPAFSQYWGRVAAWITSNWVLSVLFFGIALGFNLYRLGVPSIWFDEAFSVELASQPLPLLWHIIFGIEPNMELYYLFLHAWLGITSLLGLHATEFVVRFPSAIFAALSTVIVFLLGRRFLGLPVGLVGAGLYLLNDQQLVYAQQTRSYSLQLLLICIAWYAFLAALTGESRQKRWWLCFVLASTLAVYAHLFSLVILLAQICAFVGMLLLPQPWRAKAKRQVLALLVSLVTIGILSIPMLLVSLHGSKTGWLPIPHLSDIPHLFLTISGDSKLYLLTIALFCLLGLSVATLAYLPKGIPLLDIVRAWVFGPSKGGVDEERGPLGRLGGENAAASPRDKGNLSTRHMELQQFLPVGLALLCWLIVPLVLSFVVSQGSLRLFSSRYLVTIVPPLLLLAGMGVAALRWYRVQLVLALALFLLALLVVPLYYRSAQVEDWNATSFWIQQHYQTGDGLVCYDNEVQQGCQISIEYYLHAYPGAAHFTNDAPGAFSWTTFSAADPNAAVDPAVLAAFGTKHSRIFFITGRLPDNAAVALAQNAQNWLDSHYHFIAQIVTRTVTIRLYATNVTTSVAGMNTPGGIG